MPLTSTKARTSTDGASSWWTTAKATAAKAEEGEEEVEAEEAAAVVDDAVALAARAVGPGLCAVLAAVRLRRARLRQQP